MPPTGTTFTDWQQVQAQERGLLIDEDFTWSEEPVRKRRRRTSEESARPSRRRAASADLEPEPVSTRRRATVAEPEPVSRRAAAAELEREPASTRRPAAAAGLEPEPVSARRRAAVAELEPERQRRTVTAELEPARAYAQATVEEWESTQEPSRFDDAVQEWSAGHGESSFDSVDIASYTRALVHEDRSGSLALAGVGALPASRRTVVITGQGDERYMPAGRRRRRASELAFHERSTFKADRAGLWAVLLGVALLIGCVVH